MRKSGLLLLSCALTVSLLFQGCSATDIVKSNGKKTFKAFIEASKENVSTLENQFVYTAPSGDSFKWSRDFTLGNSDMVFELNATPFINAGLDVKKLSSDIFSLEEITNKLVMNFEMGNDKLDINKNSTASEAFDKIIDKYRTNLGYHDSLEHFGMSLPGDNKFEWAKDLSTNDKDVVFVLNPKPFLDAGVDPAKVEGWVFTNMEGKDLFLKPINIK